MNLLKKFKEKFDQEIYCYLNKKIKWGEKIDKKGAFLLKIIKDFINVGGKRIRPAIFYYAYESYSNENLGKIFKLSFVFELFHTFGLIHDDIIDNSDLRRGEPTVHKKYDVATAILVGDLTLMLADEIFFNLVKNEKVIKEYNLFKQEVLIGEYLDYKKIEDVSKIIEFKTARYSFVRPAVIGLLLADVDEKKINKWKETLRKTGTLFQLKDDFVGTFGSEEAIGKSVTSDFAEGKNTLVVEYFKKAADEKESKRFKEIFGRGKTRVEDFIWYIQKLRKKKIDDKIKKLLSEGCGEIETHLKAKFGELPLSYILTEVLEYIKDFSS